MDAANQESWIDFWSRIGASGDPITHWPGIRDAYSENWRAYHNLTHIGDCLAEFANVRELAEKPGPIEAALWFHDVVYDTRAKDSEERSAGVAETILGASGLPKEFLGRVRPLILATKHNQLPSTPDEALMVDIDLSILGQDSKRYAEFENQIRAEYSWVSPADFAAGRSAVLDGFLKRKTIFSSDIFIEKFERQARVNLGWAIARLSTG